MIALILYLILAYLAGKGRTFNAVLDDTAVLMCEKHGQASVEFYREKLGSSWLEPLLNGVYVVLAVVVFWFWLNYRIELAIEVTVGVVVLMRGAHYVLPPGPDAALWLDIAEASVNREMAAAERRGDEREIASARKAVEGLALVRAPAPLEPWRREYYEH